jgi:hypothetical protein
MISTPAIHALLLAYSIELFEIVTELAGTLRGVETVSTGR